MLNTFDNAARNASRQQERERSMRAMRDAYDDAGQAEAEAENYDASSAVLCSLDSCPTTPTHSNTHPPTSSSSSSSNSPRRSAKVPGVPAAFLDEANNEEDLIAFVNGPHAVFGHTAEREAIEGCDEEDAWSSQETPRPVDSKAVWQDVEREKSRLTGARVYGGGGGMYDAAPSSAAPPRRNKVPGGKILKGLGATFAPRRGNKADQSMRGGVQRNLAVRRHSGGYDLAVSDVPLSHVGRGEDGDGNDPGLNRFVGSALEALRAAAHFICRPCRLLVLIVAAASVPLLVHEVRSKKLFSHGASPPGSGLVHPGHPYPDHNLARIEAVAKRIINSGVSTREELSVPSDPDRMPRTPQNKAMEWIALIDPAQLNPEDDFLLQRYGLATFWFATHPEMLLPDAAEHHETASEGGVPTHSHGVESSTSPSWTKDDKWMTDTGICSWYGVRCMGHRDPHQSGVASTGGRTDEVDREKELDQYNADGEVTALVLDSNNVGGILPDEIFTTLTELEIVDLNNNGLEGTLPPSLGRLKRIHTLSLSNNDLVGTLPDSVSSLTSIRDLDLSENMFSSTIPGESLALLGDTLVELSLYGNDFIGTIPTELGRLPHVTSLYLDSNKLTGYIPRELEGCASLKDLRLRDNALTGPLPDQIGTLSNLQVLYLDSNELTGPLPLSFGRLTKLEEMNLYDNNLSGPLPQEWTALQNLKHMYLDGNGGLSGTLPSSWGTELRSLVHLYLSNNKLTGTVPPELQHLSNLEKLHLRNNRFDGPVPHEWGMLSQLKELMLEGNKFDGTIPAEWGVLHELEEMRLEMNAFTGEMPREICELREGMTNDPPPEAKAKAGINGTMVVEEEQLEVEEGKLTTLTIHCEGMEQGALRCGCCTPC